MAFPQVRESVLGLWSRHRLRFVLGLHLLLVSFATLGRWSHMSLLVHYLVFLVSLIWALALPQSEEAVLLCLVLNLLSVLLDIIALSIHFPRFALFRLPREPTEEFSAGMAILNLLARSTTQMFPTNVELGTPAAHIFIFDKHSTGARQLLPCGRSGLPEVAVVAGLLLMERFPNNHWLRDDNTLFADQSRSEKKTRIDDKDLLR